MTAVVKCDYDKTFFGDYIPKWVPFDQYKSDGVTVEYTYTFQLLDPKYLAVYVTLPNAEPNQIVDKKEYERDYIINDYGKPDGGTLTFRAPYPKGSIITLTYGSDFKLYSNFKEGRNFNGKDLDDIIKQISLNQIELSLRLLNTIRYSINIKLGDRGTGLVPILKDEHIWEGKNKEIVSIPTPSGGGSGNCCDVLREELANNNTGTDGAGMIGFKDKINNISTNLSEQVNKIIYYLQNIQVLPPSTNMDYGLTPISTPDGIIYDRTLIASFLFHSNEFLFEIQKYVYYELCDGTPRRIFEVSDSKVPYSRLGDVLWSYKDYFGWSYLFGSGTDSYEVRVLDHDEDTNACYIVVNDLDGDVNVVFENMDLEIIQERYETNVSAFSQTDYDQLLVNQISKSTYDKPFVDRGTGVKFTDEGSTSGDPWNRCILNFNTFNLDIEGGESFTIFNTTTVWYQVGGQGTAPSVPGTLMCKVVLPESHTLGMCIYLTKQALRGSLVCKIHNDFRENAWFSLKSPDMKVFINKGDKDAEYELNKITLYIPYDDLDNNAVFERIQKGINKYSYSLPDPRGLSIKVLGELYSQSKGRNFRETDPNSTFLMQTGGRVQSQSIERHQHEYLQSTGTRGVEVVRYVSGTQSLYDLQTHTSNYGGIETRGAGFGVYMYIHI